jgi:hypothetical protein
LDVLECHQVATDGHFWVVAILGRPGDARNVSRKKAKADNSSELEPMEEPSAPEPEPAPDETPTPLDEPEPSEEPDDEEITTDRPESLSGFGKFERWLWDGYR